MAFCLNCGQRNADDASQCSKCQTLTEYGAVQGAIAAPAPTAKPPEGLGIGLCRFCGGSIVQREQGKLPGYLTLLVAGALAAMGLMVELFSGTYLLLAAVFALVALVLLRGGAKAWVCTACNSKQV